MDAEPLPPGRIVIAGGSGFLGLNLARHLCQHGGEVAILARSRPAQVGPWRAITWDGRTLGPWVSELDGAAALVNLCGRSVDCVKTPDHCDEILRSRVETTRLLGQAVRQLDSLPPTWVQMATAHIYGDPPAAVCDETSPLGYGLAPTVGRAWEQAFAEAAPPEMRQVVLRTSFVLGRSGGALTRLTKLARWGLGGRVGHGRQGISWLHEHDMNRIFTRAVVERSMRGVYVATAPEPVSNAEFMRQLRRATGMPIGLPAPAWLVRLGAPLAMQTDPELAIYGRYCVPTRLQQEGFEFTFPRIDAALAKLFSVAQGAQQTGRQCERQFSMASG